VTFLPGYHSGAVGHYALTLVPACWNISVQAYALGGTGGLPAAGMIVGSQKVVHPQRRDVGRRAVSHRSVLEFVSPFWHFLQEQAA